MTEIAEFSFQVRQFLEPHWFAAHQGWGDIPQPLSCWMCRYSSIFLATLLRELHGEATWWIVVGRPPQETNATVNATAEAEVGMLAYDGTWHDHCWVEGCGLIVDLTADQFGYAPVIVTTTSDRRYRANLTEQDMAADFQKLKHRPMQWLSDWKSQCCYG